MLKFEYSEELKKRIQQCMDNRNYKYEFDENMGVFYLPLDPGGIWGLVKYHIVLYESEYMVSAQPNFHANPEDIIIYSEMAKLLCLINYNIKNGSLSMDLRGDIRHRYTVNCKNCPPSQEVIEESIWSAAWCFKYYGEAFYQVLTGQMTAAQAKYDLGLFSGCV